MWKDKEISPPDVRDAQNQYRWFENLAELVLFNIKCGVVREERHFVFFSRKSTHCRCKNIQHGLRERFGQAQLKTNLEEKYCFRWFVIVLSV